MLKKINSETPVPSPSRRICNVPANKRVEMLRNCEADLRRELSKTQSKNDGEMICNKKEPYEVNAAPLSPVKISYANGNGGRFSPRKTHLTNFISQNIAPVEMLRRQNVPDSQTGAHQQIEVYETKMKRSPCLNFNDSRAKITPPKSPTPRRRFRSQSPRVCIEESDSDSDTLNANGPVRKPTPKRAEINGNKENKTRQMWRKSRQSVAKEDIINQNTISAPCNEVEGAEAADNRPFRSMDMTNPYAESFYCPQSEPLKRKIYSEKTLDRLQKSFDMESGKFLFAPHQKFWLRKFLHEKPLFYHSQRYQRRLCCRRFRTYERIVSNKQRLHIDLNPIPNAK